MVGAVIGRFPLKRKTFAKHPRRLNANANYNHLDAASLPFRIRRLPFAASCLPLPVRNILSAPALLQLVDTSVAYGNTEAVHGISFALATGDIGCLLGPSGCGKTTALRAIAGFEPLTGGEIFLKGARISQRGAGDRKSVV